jgi:IS1 family transposase
MFIMNRLPIEKRVRILGCLTEGMSMRATSWLADVSINTVTKLLVDVGTACDLWQNETMRNLPCKRIQCDEIWCFVGKKESNRFPAEQGTFGEGDVYTYVAIDADTKLVPSWLIGRRHAQYAKTFMEDLAGRLANRVQLSTDGFRPYLTAVENAFGSEIDYGMLVKLFSGGRNGNKDERRYSSGQCCGIIKGTVCGNPDEKHLSTSFVERQNLTMRMHMRRFTRLTNGFSKKVENHACAIALHYMFYNFGKVHKSLRVTPAMQAGISDHIWSLEEIAKLAD